MDHLGLLIIFLNKVFVGSLQQETCTASGGVLLEEWERDRGILKLPTLCKMLGSLIADASQLRAS